MKALVYGCEKEVVLIDEKSPLKFIIKGFYFPEKQTIIEKNMNINSSPIEQYSVIEKKEDNRQYFSELQILLDSQGIKDIKFEQEILNPAPEISAVKEHFYKINVAEISETDFNCIRRNVIQLNTAERNVSCFFNEDEFIDEKEESKRLEWHVIE